MSVGYNDLCLIQKCVLSDALNSPGYVNKNVYLYWVKFYLFSFENITNIVCDIAVGCNEDGVTNI